MKPIYSFDQIMDDDKENELTQFRSPSKWQSFRMLERGASGRVFLNSPKKSTIEKQQNQARIKNSLKFTLTSIINPKNEPVEGFSEEQNFFRIAHRLQLDLSDSDMENIKFGTSEYYRNYEELEVLGEGCIGLVKALKNKITGEEFAVKKVMTSDEEIICNVIENIQQLIIQNQQMTREFQSLVKLSHPNIVKVHKLYIDFKDGFQNQSNVFVIMELVKGKEMFQYIQEMGHYSEGYARKLFGQLLDAINYLHQHGICHRDLKPNNLLCSEDGETLKITDFNVSKFNENYKGFLDIQFEQIEMWTYTGTVAFSAPEIFIGYGYNEKVDIWSAGCVLYTMLSGEMPFQTEFLNDLIDLIKSGKYDYKGDKWNNISTYAKDLIGKLLVINPDDRYSASDALKHNWLNSEILVMQSIKRVDLNKNINHLTRKNEQKDKKLRANELLFGKREIECQTRSFETITINIEKSHRSKFINSAHCLKQTSIISGENSPLSCSSKFSKTSIEYVPQKSKFAQFQASPNNSEYETSDKKDNEDEL